MSSVSFMRRSGGPSSNLRFAAGLLFILLKDCKEGFLRNLHRAHLLHALLAGLLLFKELALSRNVAAVALDRKSVV